MLLGQFNNPVTNQFVQFLGNGLVYGAAMVQIFHLMSCRAKIIVAFQHLMDGHKDHRSQLVKQRMVLHHAGAESRRNFFLGRLAV